MNFSCFWISLYKKQKDVWVYSNATNNDFKYILQAYFSIENDRAIFDNYFLFLIRENSFGHMLIRNLLFYLFSKIKCSFLDFFIWIFFSLRKNLNLIAWIMNWLFKRNEKGWLAFYLILFFQLKTQDHLRLIF